MPKKGAKGGKDAKGKGKAKDEPPDVSVQMKRVRQEMQKVVGELGIPPEAELDKLFISKINETLLAQSQKFVFQGDRPDSTTLGVKVFTALLKELCPQFVPTKTLCFWRSQLGDEGVAAICEHLLSKKKSEKEPPYGGVVNLELFDCRLGPSVCRFLSQSLHNNVPLKTLLLDHNDIGDQGLTLLAEGLRVCHTRDSFDEGRRAQHGLQMPLLGAAARPRLGEAARPRRPLRVGIVTRSSASARRITNEDELVAGCPRGLRCEKVALDEAGAERNARRVLRYHALVALHGAHVTYASFPERPLALLEVKPHAMFPSWFQHFHPSAFALDTWMYVYDAGPHPGDAATRVAGHTTRRLRASANGNKQPAALPLPIFRQFACLVAERFESYYRAPPLALRPAVRALL